MRIIAAFAALYYLLFAALGAEVPFIPHLLATADLPPAEVGFVLAAGTVAQVLATPVFGRIADRVGSRLVLCVAALAAAASLLLMVAASGALWAALLVYIFFSIASAPLNPLADALTVPACAQAGIPYGRIRGVGSAGFFTGILLSSTIAARLGTSSVVVTAAVLFALTTVALPRLGPTTSRPLQEEPSGGLGTLLRNRAFRRVLLVATLVIGSHAMSDAFAVILWRSSGVAADTIGVMLAIAVVSEFLVFMLVGPFLLERLGPSVCAAVGAVAGVVRWTILAEAPTLWPVLASQMLHGLTFSLVHLACMQALASVAPRRFFATAQSLYGICSNAIASSVITLASGVLFGTMHAHAFLFAAILCVLAIPVALRLICTRTVNNCGN